MGFFGYRKIPFLLHFSLYLAQKNNSPHLYPYKKTSVTKEEKQKTLHLRHTFLFTKKIKTKIIG